MVDGGGVVRCGQVRTHATKPSGADESTPDDHDLIPYERDLLRWR